MGAIRGQFYPDATPKQWAQDSHFILRRVVLWPASWLTKKGITLPPSRYKQILLEVFNEIKVHGATDSIKFWPGYLAKCVQERFNKHAEELYQEGKNIRTLAEQVLTAAGTAKLPPSVDPITVLAEHRRDLLQARKTRKQTCPKQTPQLPLF